MIKIRVVLRTGYVGAEIEEEFEVEVGTTEEEIDQIAEDFVENMKSELDSYWEWAE